MTNLTRPEFYDENGVLQTVAGQNEIPTVPTLKSYKITFNTNVKNSSASWTVFYYGASNLSNASNFLWAVRNGSISGLAVTLEGQGKGVSYLILGISNFTSEGSSPPLPVATFELTDQMSTALTSYVKITTQNISLRPSDITNYVVTTL